MEDLTEIQQKVFDEVKSNWEQRVGVGKVDEDSLARMIKLSDVHGDGKKRIAVANKGTFLVPIEDIILIGVTGEDIEKYPKIEE